MMNEGSGWKVGRLHEGLGHLGKLGCHEISLLTILLKTVPLCQTCLKFGDDECPIILSKLHVVPSLCNVRVSSSSDLTCICGDLASPPYPHGSRLWWYCKVQVSVVSLKVCTEETLQG